MARAAILPAATASTTVAGPLTQSPPAKTPGTGVARGFGVSLDPPAVQREEAFPRTVLPAYRLRPERSFIQHLADGEDNAVGGEELPSFQGDRAPAAAGIRLAQEIILINSNCFSASR